MPSIIKVWCEILENYFIATEKKIRSFKIRNILIVKRQQTNKNSAKLFVVSTKTGYKIQFIGPKGIQRVPSR